MRKGTGIPYITHPMDTAVIMATMTEDKELIAAAILHDVVEDCGVEVDNLPVNYTVKMGCKIYDNKAIGRRG